MTNLINYRRKMLKMEQVLLLEKAYKLNGFNGFKLSSK